jgi:hypothetical protein
MGNGVGAIKLGLMQELKEQGWKLEHRVAIVDGFRVGKVDAVLDTSMVLLLSNGKQATFSPVTEP